jgi:GNAT superfamily N-acetyltransferase
MSNVSIVAVNSRKERKEFLSLPWKLYANDPNWIPPIRHNQKELVNYRKHPFYENAEVQTFIARKNGETVGRVAAIIDHGHNEYYDERRGMIGFFESKDDMGISRGLFDAARKWFAEKDIKLLRGPLNPSMNYECGLLIDGFDSPPCFMMTYNPPYYEKLFDDYGFKKTQDLYAYYAHVDMLNSVDPKMIFIVEEAAKRFNVKVRPVHKKNFKQEIMTFLEIYNRAMPGNWGYVPMSKSEVKTAAEGLKFLMVHELSVMAEVEGKEVGVVFGLLDYNPIIKKIDGRMFPFGFLRILMGRKKLTRVRLVSTTVLPEYQRWGLGVVLLAKLLPKAIDWGLVDCELSWVLESNTLSRGTIERGGADLIKTYRIYDYEPS